VIPTLSVAALFEGPGQARARCDRALLDAASTVGFLVLDELPQPIAPTAAVRAELLRIFSTAPAVRRRLWRRVFDPAHPNIYRGWFPAQSGAATYKEGIDMGPDVAHDDFPVDAADPLTEPTPLPSETELPGWRAAVRRYYLGMESLAGALTHALARGLGLTETAFDGWFAGGLSTLRLIRYPVRPPESFAGAPPADTFVEHDGQTRHTIGMAHVDTGCLTLLAQNEVGGLQARGLDGGWLDVPPLADTVVVNFGALLGRWTGGRIRATEHRVLGSAEARCSIPFFYEPRVDARISPLPGMPDFEPFVFGDYLWAAVTRFVEFRGLENVRAPRRG
jgi:isopenicillin N synthase-like dioxygenase